MDEKKADGLEIRCSVAPQVNFAFQQNAVPVIRELLVVNNTQATVRNVCLVMMSSPAFLSEKRWSIDSIAPDSESAISDRDVKPDGNYLMGLAEQQQGEILFRLVGDDGAVLAERREPIQVLARNEWGGYGSTPELLAAFSMPNEPAVDKLLRAVSDRLRSNGQDGTLQRYDAADPERVWIQVSAVWSVLAALKLDYAYPPASFERTGQKIRTPDDILVAKRGTCLDTTMLMCSLLEQIGLHPVVMLERGHAYAGVWLVPQTSFNAPYSEDIMGVRKRVQLKELVVFETTLLCKGARFKQAIETAENQLLNSSDKFVGVVDIACARDRRILPLSFLTKAESAVAGEAVLPEGNSDLELPDEGVELGGENYYWNTTGETETAGGRLANWQRRLLDLSLRNPLLNMRTGKTCFPIVAPDVGALEDTLAEGNALSLEPVPSTGERDKEIHEIQRGENLDKEMALAALKRNTIYAPLDEKLLSNSMVELYRKAKNDLEEGGANTLFLGIGVLNWVRPKMKGKIYRSPLVLVPINIERKSVRSGIKISLSDDEVRFNTTLLELLKQDFSIKIEGLDGPLPEDHKGTDINMILNRVRKEVLDIPGFEVRDEAVIGTFSFSKYLMWKDLIDRTAQLKDNPVVKHLIETPKETFKESLDFINPASLDKDLPADKIYTPLSSDSSQLAAVIASSGGKNFVMLGPPGTGKSQTISNMIAHNLGLGRTVLFVAEKAAALGVVQRRLKEHGLGEFCLELHSNKAKKLDVIKQLGEAWGITGNYNEATWKAETAKLTQVRDTLNVYVKELHHVHPNGLSIREGIGIIVANKDIPAIPLAWDELDGISEEQREAFAEIGNRVDVNLKQIGDALPYLKNVQEPDWSLAWQEKVLGAAENLIGSTEKFQSELDSFLKLIRADNKKLSNELVISVVEMSQAFAASYGKNLECIFLPNFPEVASAWDKAKALLEKYNNAVSQLSVKYDRERLLSADLVPAENAFNTAQTGWWGAKIFAKWKGSGYLSKNVGAQGKANLVNDVPLIKSLREIVQSLRQDETNLKSIPGWNGLDSNVGDVDIVVGIGNRIRDGLGKLAESADELAAMRSAAKTIVVDGNEMLNSDGTYGKQLVNLNSANSAFKTDFDAYASLLKKAPEVLLTGTGGLDGVLAEARGLIERKDKINAVCAWVRVKKDAEAARLLPVMEALERGYVSPGNTENLILVNYLRWWTPKKFDANEILRRFVSAEHEMKITNFVELDDKVRKITSDYLRAKIRTGIQDFDHAQKGTELGIIKRELEKKTRHKPLRQLLSEAPNAIPTLTPCLLMSPLSIAQYLPVDQKPFDVVIFDEASQITVWDAIGAIARGRQTIMVGDPKQLPPTSFFAAGAPGNEEDVDDEDLDSILDEMIGANLPCLGLSWHYRSKNESLIAFSNEQYYKGELVTFPSPATLDNAVSMQFVNGIYDRGSKQVNMMEAEAIVAEIEKRLSGAKDKVDTIGVVTFNQKQQSLILDLLDTARRNNLDLDKYFAEDLIEPVFVKNLESVQGDERDVILFSTTFGPDKDGVFSMNFGPLNKAGGERRLNVAITRARRELKVFSSIRSENIDLSRTGALGVRDLKKFLEFAENRISIHSADNALLKFGSRLEEAVARDLEGKGWTVRPRVGVSKFRVDIGVVDPRDPERYLAGIECDGATYRDSATARDRDMIRGSVLRGLGWNILRLWASDYWISPKETIDKIDEKLRGFIK